MKLKESKRKITESYYADAFDQAVTAEKVNSALDRLGDNTTSWIPIIKIDDKQYALVFGIDPETGEILGKIAYNDSYMKEYDMDWIMPYDEDTGDVWDTEISISGDIQRDIDWWKREWNSMDTYGVFDDDVEYVDLKDIDDDYDYNDEDDDFYESCHKRSKRRKLDKNNKGV